MNEQARPLQRLLALDKFGTSLQDRILEASRIIRLDVELSASDAGLSTIAYRSELHEWVLKWILEKVQHGKDSARSNPLSWRLIRQISKELPPPTLSRALKAGQLLPSISSTLHDLFPNYGPDALSSAPSSSTTTNESDRTTKASSVSSKKRKRAAVADNYSSDNRDQVFQEVFATVKYVLQERDSPLGKLFAVPLDDLHALLQHWIRAASVIFPPGRTQLGGDTCSLEESLQLAQGIWKRPYPLWDERSNHISAVNKFGWDLLRLAASHTSDTPDVVSSETITPSHAIGSLLAGMFDENVMEPIYASFIAISTTETADAEALAIKELGDRLRPIREAFEHAVTSYASNTDPVLGRTLQMLMALSSKRVTSTRLKRRKLQATFGSAVFDMFVTGLEQAKELLSLDKRKCLLLALLQGLKGHREIIGITSLTAVLNSYSTSTRMPLMNDVARNEDIQMSDLDAGVLSCMLKHQPLLFNAESPVGVVGMGPFLRLLAERTLPSKPSEVYWINAIVVSFIEAQYKSRAVDAFSKAWVLSITSANAIATRPSVWSNPLVKAALAKLIQERLEPSQVKEIFDLATSSIGERITVKYVGNDTPDPTESALFVMATLTNMVRSDGLIDGLNEATTNTLKPTLGQLHEWSTNMIRSRQTRAYYWEALMSLHVRIFASTQAEAYEQIKLPLIEQWLEREERTIGNALDLIRANCQKTEAGGFRSANHSGLGLESAISYVLHWYNMLQQSSKFDHIRRAIHAVLIGTRAEGDSPSSPMDAAQPDSALALYPELFARSLKATPGFRAPADWQHDLVLALALSRDLPESESRRALAELYTQHVNHTGHSEAHQLNETLAQSWIRAEGDDTKDRFVHFVLDLWRPSRKSSASALRTLEMLSAVLDVQARDEFHMAETWLGCVIKVTAPASATSPGRLACAKLLFTLASAIDRLDERSNSFDTVASLDLICQNIFSKLSLQDIDAMEDLWKAWDSDSTSRRNHSRHAQAIVIANFYSAVGKLSGSALPHSATAFNYKAMADYNTTPGQSASRKLAVLAKQLESTPPRLWALKEDQRSLVVLRLSADETSAAEGAGSELISEAGSLPVTLTRRGLVQLYSFDLHPRARHGLDQLISITVDDLSLDEQASLAEALLTSDLRDNSHSALAVAGLVIGGMKRLDGIDVGTSQTCRRLLPTISNILATAQASPICYAALRCVRLILKDQRQLVSQSGVEELLNALLILTHPSAPLKTRASSHSLYTQLCTTTYYLITFHRHNLRGRHHLLVPLLCQLQSCLFTPHDLSPSSSSSRRSKPEVQHPPWLDASDPASALTPNHAARFARLVTALCNPAPSTVVHRAGGGRKHPSSSSRAQQQQPSLTDEVRAARVDVADHVGRLLAAYCHAQLHGALSGGDASRAQLTEGVHAMLDVLRLAAPEREDADVRVRVLGAGMSKEALALLRREHGEWKRFGTWRG